MNAHAPARPSFKGKPRMALGTTVAALAIATVGHFEGLRTEPYRDIIGVPTICYGETRGVTMDDHATREECDAMLVQGLQDFERGVMGCTTATLPDSRLVAVVSFAYNVGIGAYCQSSVARKLNAGDVKGGCNALLLYNKARKNGKLTPVKGLTARRNAERDLCMRAA